MRNKTLCFDLNQGRDEKRKDGMGRIVIKKFTDPEPKMRDLMYDTDVEGGFGGAAKGVPTFDKIVARDDAVGPHGEKPASAAEAATAAAVAIPAKRKRP